jgi:lipopolysaccharide/colanic/teichoic acid biosynthesis glycosyltransferase
MTKLYNGYILDGMNEFERNVKRGFDFIVSILCLVVFSPLFAYCYFRIKSDDGGPVIYKQERIGRFGRPFNIYKFRTMIVNNEQNGIPQLAEANDDRLTPFGRWLRSHHLDELPQLWNVLKGDMSLIGPRPERKYFIDQILEHDPRYVELYKIRPGITSYATLYNGYTDTMDKMLRRLELDLYFLEHRSWWFDLKIIGKTLANIVFGKKF